MSDPLSLLRYYNINKRVVIECENEIIFGKHSWEKNVKTNYIISGSAKESPEYYTLESILFLLKNATLAHRVYVRKVTAENIPVVYRSDRKDLLAFLNGETSTATNIDHNAPPPNVQQKRAAEEHYLSTNKRACMEPRIGPSGDSNIVRGICSEKMLKDKEVIIKVEPFIKSEMDSETEEQEKEKEQEQKQKQEQQQQEEQQVKQEQEQQVKQEQEQEQKQEQQQQEEHQVKQEQEQEQEQEQGQEQEQEQEQGQEQGQGIKSDMTKEIQARERYGRNQNTIMQSANKFRMNKKLKKEQEQSVKTDMTKEIQAREIYGRTRNSILQSANKDFKEKVLTILKFVTTHIVALSGPPKIDNLSASSKKKQAPLRYNRYDQEQFVQCNEEVDGFRIETRATYHHIPFKSVGERKHHEQNQQEQQKPPLQLQQHPSPSGSVKIGDPTKRLSRTPIIIVPATPVSLITMYNAKDILQDLRFVSTEEKKLTGQCPEKEILIQHYKCTRQIIPYRVIDNPLKLCKEDWRRVVAVFVIGPTWQFKGWPWGGKPVDIISNVCAFHVKYEDMNLDNNVKCWNVTVIELSRLRRHLDRAAFKVFWEQLERFMKIKKPYLRF